MSQTTTRIHDTITKILLQHPEIDLCTIKKKGQSFDTICQLLTERCRRPFTITLLTLFVTYYYPTPDNFKERLDKLDQSLLDQLVKDAWSGSPQDKRRVLEDLLTEEESSSTTLGYALRISGYSETSFYLSSCQISDYSANTLARAVMRQAKTLAERQYAKEIILHSLQEELSLQLIFLPLNTLRDDLLLIETPSDLTDNYCYDFVCPLTQRHVYLNLPDCYRLTSQGCSKISLFLAADCALGCLLWRWLRLATCSQYNLLVTSVNLDQAKSLFELRYFIDLFISPYHYLLKEVIGDCLANKYLLSTDTSKDEISLFDKLYQDDRRSIHNLLAECLVDFGCLDSNLFREKIKIYLKACPS